MHSDSVSCLDDDIGADGGISLHCIDSNPITLSKHETTDAAAQDKEKDKSGFNCQLISNYVIQQILH